MRIMFITHYSTMYGANRSLIEFLEGLDRCQFEPYVVIPNRGEIEGFLAEINVPYVILNCEVWVSRSTNKKLLILLTYLKRIIISVVSLSRIIEELKIDLIYTNSSMTPVGSFASRFKRIPHIWYIREALELHYDYKFIFGKLMTLHIIHTSGVVVANSNFIKKYLGNDHNTQIIYNGVCNKNEYDSRFLEKKVINMKNIKKRFTFLMVGTISPNKHQDLAIQALQKVHEKGYLAELVICGTGSDAYVQKCESLANEYNLENYVIFTGYQKNVNDMYLNSDCLLVCSEHEAFGRVIVEAMSYGLPVIARNSGGIPEIIADNINGHLFDTLDALIINMLEVQRDDKSTVEIGKKGWEMAKEKYSNERNRNEINNLLRSFLPINDDF